VTNQEDKKRILVLVPGKAARGGITAYYSSLGALFSLPIDYCERGARSWPVKGNSFSELIRLMRDYYLFIIAISSGKYSLVVTNTSFSSLSILRDGLYILFSKVFGIKTIVFFHGWDYVFADKLYRRYFKIFKSVYFKADAIIDLALKNKKILKEWGYKKQVYLETVVVDKYMVENVSEEQISDKYFKKEVNLLFLARLERTKGIYEAIEAFVILKKQFPKVRMTIAGEGREFENVKNYIQIAKIDNITLTGFIEGDRKIDIFVSSDIYLFPSYNEGMPTSLVEAMAFGLPIVTSNVGAISDFFVNERNGYITENNNPLILASLVNLLIVNSDKAKAMALNNFNYAKERFYSDKVVLRVENILLDVLKMNLKNQN
jgi:glycosyltransferase involved in cell wall biosynthesis